MSDEPRFTAPPIVRLPPHPYSAHHSPTAPQEHVDRAVARVSDLIERMGFAEALWVAEELGYEWGVLWNPQTGNLTVELSDLQMVAFSAAMRSHHAATYPTPERLHKDVEHSSTKNGRSRTKKRRQPDDL